MRHLAASPILAPALAALVAGAGCVSISRHDSTAPIVDGVLIAAGGALMAHSARCQDYDHDNDCDRDPFSGEGLLGAGLFIGGGLALLTTLLLHAGDQPEHPGAGARGDARGGAPDVRLHDPAVRVRVLTIEAHDWARHGRCDVVRKLGAQIEALDPDYHATVFAADSELAACR